MGGDEMEALLPLLYEPAIRAALEEDLGRAGDLTSQAVIPIDAEAEGRIVARAAGVVAGLEVALAAFYLLDPGVRHAAPVVADGTPVRPGQTLAAVVGQARSVLGAERTALNFLAHLSGIATATGDLVRLVEGTGARIVDTRKTTPGLRSLEKYAVRCGGGGNHRFGLDDAVLIKDNHIVVAGGVEAAVRRARAHVGHTVKLEVETDTLEQLDEALAAGADVVLLDNFSLEALREAVRRTAGRALLEASGGITATNLRAIAETGVDLVSVGWITHSAPALDVTLELSPVVSAKRSRGARV